MTMLSSLLVALGLSMDNFAVTIASGCARHNAVSGAHILQVSVLFALAHFIMFTAGWVCGEGVGHLIGAVSPWAAFFILAFIGSRMVKESREAKAENDVCLIHSFKTLAVLSVATSVDALLVGMGLALTQAPFWLTVWTLVTCVFITSWTGFYVGVFLGRKFGKAMEALGGLALIVIGLKLLLEGVGIW